MMGSFLNGLFISIQIKMTIIRYRDHLKECGLDPQMVRENYELAKRDFDRCKHNGEYSDSEVVEMLAAQNEVALEEMLSCQNDFIQEEFIEVTDRLRKLHKRFDKLQKSSPTREAPSRTLLLEGFTIPNSFDLI